MSSTNSSTAGTYVNIEFGYCIQKSQKNIHINNKTEQNEKNGDCQLQNIMYLTQCFPLSMGRCYCWGITRIHRSPSRPRPFHKADSRSH